MIIPQYWAEGRLRNRDSQRQITVRRFGWSDLSQAEAQAHADLRTREALDRLIAGEKLNSREQKVPYNGADGLPIREEIVARHGEAIITRNLYGARCLNHPSVLFADVDIEDSPPFSAFQGVLILGGLASWYGLDAPIGSFFSFLGGYLITLIVCLLARSSLIELANFIFGTPEKRAMKRVRKFSEKNPDWHLRLYRTPAGLRVLVLHRTFDPREPAVKACFRALAVDSLYAKMCRNQQCFRARLTPKPWRIGIETRMCPRPGFWPVNPERLPERTRWIEAYEAASRAYAACRFVETLGSGLEDPTARAVRILHDDLCQALTPLPIA